MALSVVESWAGWIELPSNKTTTNKTACSNFRCCNLSSGTNASLWLILCTTFGADCHPKMAWLTANSVFLAKMSTCKCFYSCPFSFNFLLLDLFLKVHGPGSVGQVFLGKFFTWEVLWSFLNNNNGGINKNGIKTMELITNDSLILFMTLNEHWLAFVSPPGLNYMYVWPKFFRLCYLLQRTISDGVFLWVAIVLALKFLIPTCSYVHCTLVNVQIALEQPGVNRNLLTFYFTCCLPDKKNNKLLLF